MRICGVGYMLSVLGFIFNFFLFCRIIFEKKVIFFGYSNKFIKNESTFVLFIYFEWDTWHTSTYILHTYV